MIFLAPSKNEFFQERADPPHMHNRICVVNLWNGEILKRERSRTDFFYAPSKIQFFKDDAHLARVHKQLAVVNF